jgi:hypothetical protein
MAIREKIKPTSGKPAIAKAIQAAYTNAVSIRDGKSSHFDKSVSKVLKDCHNDRRGILSEDEKEIADELCHIGLEFSKRKMGQAFDIFADTVRHSVDQPIFEPTDVPELTDSLRQEILQKSYKELLGQGFAGDLTEDLIRPLKLETLAKYKDEASKKAQLAEKSVRDMLEEMDYDNEMRRVIDDLTSMPIAVACYPAYEYKEVSKWSGDKFTTKKKLVSTLKRVSPFDFYMIDGIEPKKCAAVIEVCRVHPSELEGMIGESDWFDDEIESSVSECAKTNIQSFGGYQNREKESGIIGKDEIEFIKFYGKLPRTLFEGAKIKLDNEKTTYVEMIVFVSGEKILYAKQQRANSAQFRPYYATSYEKLNGSAYGVAIAQRTHKASRIARSMVYAMVRNAGFTAQPTGEMDIARLQEFNHPDDLTRLNIGKFLHSSPDVTGRQGGHVNAVSTYNIPNYMAQYQSGVTFFLDIIDLLSAVPKISSGDMRGLATLGRSFRGIAMVQAAESKSTKAALDNFDKDIQEPIFLAMYNELMSSTKNSNLKGDIRVKARGTSGYTTKEAKAAARQESLQQLAPFSAQIPPNLMEAVLRGFIEDMGIDTERYYGGVSPSEGGAVAPEVTESPSFGGEKIPV